MRLTFLGTGSTSGPPVFRCGCTACAAAREDPSRRRRPASAVVEEGGSRLYLDAGRSDLADLVSREPADAILLTHFHVDHVQGLFPLRWGAGARIPVYAPHDPGGCADLLVHPGILDVRVARPFEPFSAGALDVVPVPLAHSKPTLGYCLSAGESRIAYLVDTRGLPTETAEFLARWRPAGIVVDCSYPPGSAPARGHNDLDDVLRLVAGLRRPVHCWLTHIGHELDRSLFAGLPTPPTVHAARDGEEVVAGSLEQAVRGARPA